MSPLLRRSFDSAKCKTVLQLTVQKLKILRNKHALAVKSLRADVARLLEKGQDDSAKTQVDNVFREEKIVALYNILEQFCQLVVNRLEIIKSQRECPSDLKEAVASLIYAASRCEEIEELKKVSSYLTNKYGTEFSLAAKELRSECGVNTQVIQDLSSLPLSSDARMKLLKDVAVENRISWDYDTTIADMSKQPTDSLEGPIHPTSRTQTSNAEGRRPASMSMHVNEVNERATGALKTAFNSRIMSPKTALDSPLHNMHQSAKINTSLETKEVSSPSRAKIIPTSTLDPYALAKLQGRMDYKLVSEDKGREFIIEEHLNSASSFKLTQSNGQSRSPGSSKMLNIKQMSTAGRQDMETQLLELEAAAKTALESASEAAEAARAAVAMVRKGSLGSIKTCRLENTKKPEGKHSESSPDAVLDEARFDAIKDDSRFSPLSADNSVVLNNYASEDTQQSSGSQERSLQAHDSAKLDTMISAGKESRSTEVLMSSSIGSFYSTYEREEDVDWKISPGQKQERLFIEERIQQDKSVKNISAEPQFDDYSSEEALEEERPSYASKNASSKHQHENIFGVVEVQSDKDVQKECSVPQFDDNSIEANEDKTPFYLKGRAAMVGMAKARSSKLMAISPTDDTIEESSSSNLEDAKKEVNLNAEYQEEPLDSSSNTGAQAFIEKHLDHSLEFTGNARPSNKSLKDYYTSPIDALSGESGSESSYLYSRYDNLPSPLKSVRSFSPTGGLSDHEDENPLSHVRQNLKWCSTISDTSESSIESYKPCNLEDSSLQLPNSYFGGPRATKQDSEISPQSIEASQTKYKGMSRRSVRSSRPRQIQNNPSSTA